MNKEEIYKKAIRKNGIQAQVDMVIEECAELIQALNKVKRKGGMLGVDYKIIHPTNYIGTQQPETEYAISYANLCGEVADVKIMIGQLEEMLNKETINLCEVRKLERLKERIK